MFQGLYKITRYIMFPLETATEICSGRCSFKMYLVAVNNPKNTCGKFIFWTMKLLLEMKFLTSFEGFLLQFSSGNFFYIKVMGWFIMDLNI